MTECNWLRVNEMVEKLFLLEPWLFIVNKTGNCCILRHFFIHFDLHQNLFDRHHANSLFIFYTTRKRWIIFEKNNIYFLLRIDKEEESKIYHRMFMTHIFFSTVEIVWMLEMIHCFCTKIQNPPSEFNVNLFKLVD